MDVKSNEKSRSPYADRMAYGQQRRGDREEGVRKSYTPLPDRNEMVSLLRAAVDRGVTSFDTAEVYGPYTNEGLVGEGRLPRAAVIATKFGYESRYPEPIERLSDR